MADNWAERWVAYLAVMSVAATESDWAVYSDA